MIALASSFWQDSDFIVTLSPYAVQSLLSTGALGSLAQAPASVWTAVLMLGIFPAALGYATWTVTLNYFGAARASNFLYLTPAVATAFSMALTGERPGLPTLLGGLLTIAGVVFVALRGRT